ncbi:hypothetical protein GCM10010411_23720 [Actinomadura fulvescens]|uniref:Uncharacterized protein n=1 Tax=Actinomadura fulvescens TaxID=46160 RepID=A0ABP6BWV9_9ACTN
MTKAADADAPYQDPVPGTEGGQHALSRDRYHDQAPPHHHGDGHQSEASGSQDRAGHGRCGEPSHEIPAPG